MSKMSCINVGDVVTPKLKQGIRRLILWSEGNNPSEVVSEVDKNELLTVIRIEFYNTQKKPIQPEWSKSSCLLLGPKGELGWTGTGWIKKILPTTSSS